MILFAHGSRDPKWRLPLEALLIASRQQDPELEVELAFLEFGQTLECAMAALEARSCPRIWVVAAMISAGGKHVQQDMPALVAEVAARNPQIELTWIPEALGTNASVIRAMATAAISHLPDPN